MFLMLGIPYKFSKLLSDLTETVIRKVILSAKFETFDHRRTRIYTLPKVCRTWQLDFRTLHNGTISH